MIESGGNRTFVHRMRVYYEDTDAAGIVYYANYLKFAERGRTEALRAIGIEQRDFAAKTGVVFAVRRLRAEFILPARLDDDLEVVTRTTDIGGATLTMEQVIRRGDDTLVTLDVAICAVGAKGGRTGRPVRIPQEVVSRLQPQAPKRSPSPETANISPQTSRKKQV